MCTGLISQASGWYPALIKRELPWATSRYPGHSTEMCFTCSFTPSSFAFVVRTLLILRSPFAASSLPFIILEHKMHSSSSLVARNRLGLGKSQHCVCIVLSFHLLVSGRSAPRAFLLNNTSYLPWQFDMQPVIPGTVIGSICYIVFWQKNRSRCWKYAWEMANVRTPKQHGVHNTTTGRETIRDQPINHCYTRKFCLLGSLWCLVHCDHYSHNVIS